MAFFKLAQKVVIYVGGGGGYVKNEKYVIQSTFTSDKIISQFVFQ